MTIMPRPAVTRMVEDYVTLIWKADVLVIHDPIVAAHADRVIFIADGTPVTELNDTITAEAIASTMLDIDERAESAVSR